MKQLTYLSLVVLILVVSCENNGINGEDDPDQPFIYASLTAEQDTLFAGETTKIIATASGYRLEYRWPATAGDILGSGSEVTYAVSPCHMGKNKITCRVSDGNNVSESKEIFIVVK